MLAFYVLSFLGGSALGFITWSFDRDKVTHELIPVPFAKKAFGAILYGLLASGFVFVITSI